MVPALKPKPIAQRSSQENLTSRIMDKINEVTKKSKIGQDIILSKVTVLHLKFGQSLSVQVSP